MKLATILLITGSILLSLISSSYAGNSYREDLPESDFLIASLKLGYSLTQVKEVYPDIKFIKSSNLRGEYLFGMGLMSYVYGTDGLRLTFQKTEYGYELLQIHVISDKYPTARGIKVGSSVEKVIETYGGEKPPADRPYMYYDDAPYICFKIDMDKMVVKMITISYGD